ncbi:tetratricopeptide repeat protein [Actinosynnema sp. CA-299493]
MTENVDQLAERLSGQWLEVPHGYGLAAALEVHRATLDLADRHPLAESAADPLEIAAQVYARMGLFQAATTMAARAVELREAHCLDLATEDRLVRHVFALDLLASTYRARGLTDAITGCLVQLVELHFTCGNNAGVAWAVRELGAHALLTGDLDNAIAKFTRADELYSEDSETNENNQDPELASERGECRVLLGRARLARGDRESALLWFKRAVDDFTTADADALVLETETLQTAVQSGAELPPPDLLVIGDFGTTTW